MKAMIKNFIGFMVGAFIVVTMFGVTVNAAERFQEGQNRIARGSGGGVTLTCSSTKASFKYTNLTGKTGYMEATGTVSDVLGNEITTLYAHEYTSGSISKSYSGNGIYNINFYGHIYDGPNASYKCIDETISSYR